MKPCIMCQPIEWEPDNAPKSPASRLFTQPFVQAQIKENIKAPRHWLLRGGFPGGRWIARTNSQQRGKCFQLMTSSWYGWVGGGNSYTTTCVTIISNTSYIPGWVITFFPWKWDNKKTPSNNSWDAVKLPYDFPVDNMYCFGMLSNSKQMGPYKWIGKFMSIFKEWWRLIDLIFVFRNKFFHTLCV